MYFEFAVDSFSKVNCKVRDIVDHIFYKGVKING